MKLFFGWCVVLIWTCGIAVAHLWYAAHTGTWNSRECWPFSTKNPPPRTNSFHSLCFDCLPKFQKVSCVPIFNSLTPTFFWCVNFSCFWHHWMVVTGKWRGQLKPQVTFSSDTCLLVENNKSDKWCVFSFPYDKWCESIKETWQPHLTPSKQHRWFV